jgi:hypothetical protein
MNPLGFLVRSLFCFLVLFVTWNPTGVSYLAWLHASWPFRPWSAGGHLPELAIAGTALFATNLFLLRTAWLSLRLRGMLAVVIILLFGGLAADEAGWLSVWRQELMPYVPMLAIWAIVTAGMVRSIIRRRVLGQSDVLNPPP